MAKPPTRSYSRYSRDAAQLFGLLIRSARIDRQLTVEQLAERAGVSRGLVYRAEEGDMGCAIGAVFELATIVGVPLFSADQPALALHLANAHKILSLLPRAVRTSRTALKDDF